VRPLETLIEQADYFVPMTNRERWEHYAYSLVQLQAILFSGVSGWPQLGPQYASRMGTRCGRLWPPVR
jgi:hypothetical protein